MPRHPFALAFVLGLAGICDVVDDDDVAEVQTPFWQIHPAPGCAPGQLPAPPEPVLVASPLFAPAGSNCQAPFWQTQSAPGASPGHVSAVLPVGL